MAKLSKDYIEYVLKLTSDEARKELHELEKANKELQAQNRATRKEMVELEKQGKKGSEEWKNLRKSVTEYNKVIAENELKMKEVSKQIDLSGLSVNELTKKLNSLKKEFNDTSKSADPKRYKELRSELTNVQAALDKAKYEAKGLHGAFSSLKKMKETLTGFFIAIGAAITTQVINAFKQLVTTIMDFEKANSKLAAVLGTSVEGIKSLTDQAKELGRTTTATASEVTQLQTELAKLGFAPDIIEQMTPAVLKFAKAVDTDLGSAAAFAGSAMRMFNKDASETESVLATFAVATTKSALDFGQLQSALSTVGPVANAFGISLEDTVALLGQLSNAGFDASSAATATRNILLNLADSSGDLAQALGRPVTSLDDMVAGLQKLNAEGVDLGQALELTDKRSVAAFTTFLNGADSMLELRNAITDCTGGFNQMTETMTDNSAGALAAFQSAIEGLILRFSGVGDILTWLYEKGTELANWIGEWVDAMAPLGATAGVLLKILGGIVEIIGSFIGWVSRLVTQFKLMRVVVNTVVAGFVAYKVATLACWSALKKYLISLAQSTAALVKETAAKVANTVATKGATAAIKAFTKSLMTNPYTAVAVAIAALTTAFLGLTDKVEENGDAFETSKKKLRTWRDAMGDAEAKLTVQKEKLIALRKVAMDDNDTMERRLKAINELNSIVPNYNASIDATTGAYRESKKALDAYISSLEKKIRIEAAKDQYNALIKEEQADMENAYKSWKKLRDDYETSQSRKSEKKLKVQKDNPIEIKNGLNGQNTEIALNEKRASSNSDYNKLTENRMAEAASMDFMDWYQKKAHAANIELAEFKEFLNEIGISIEELADEDPLATTRVSADKTVTRLKEINDELKKLRKIDPKSDEEKNWNVFKLASKHSRMKRNCSKENPRPRISTKRALTGRTLSNRLQTL